MLSFKRNEIYISETDEHIPRVADKCLGSCWQRIPVDRSARVVKDWDRLLLKSEHGGSNLNLGGVSAVRESEG